MAEFLIVLVAWVVGYAGGLAHTWDRLRRANAVADEANRVIDQSIAAGERTMALLDRINNRETDNA